MQSSLIVRSSLNYSPEHQSAVTNPMHLLSTYTPHLRHLSNESRIWNPVEHVRWSFFPEIVSAFSPLAIFTTQELHRRCLTGF